MIFPLVAILKIINTFGNVLKTQRKKERKKERKNSSFLFSFFEGKSTELTFFTNVFLAALDNRMY